jgi:TonB family protein
LLALFFGITAVPAQTIPTETFKEREAGIASYRSGNLKQAIKSLREATKKNKNDESAFYYLGLALSDSLEMKEASKAFEQTIRLKPDFGPAHTGLAYTLLFTSKARDAESQARYALSVDRTDAQANYIVGIILHRRLQCREALEHAELALTTDPKFAPAYLLKSQALLCFNNRRDLKQAGVTGNQPEASTVASRSTEAANSLEKYLELKPDVSDAAFWRTQLEELRFHAQSANSGKERTIFSGAEVGTKARVLAKPEPSYTEPARRAGTVGTVVLRAIFAADGSVQHIFVISALPNGLTERAVVAARKIKFVPALKDGKPVSTYIQLEYNFNLY